MNIPMIDTLCAIIDISQYETSAMKILIELENKKNEAKILASKLSSDKITYKIGDLTFEVLGNGSKGYAYILHNDDYEVKLAQFRSNRKDFYPIFVRIKSEYLWSVGPENAWKLLLQWIDRNIGNVISNKINRLDLCCHTDEMQLSEEDLETFKGNFHSDQIFRFRRKVNAMIFGSREGSKVYCRIYNKTLEIKQKHKKLWFLDIWQNKGLDTEKVWNVEFEIKRDFFKEHKIDSVEDAFNRLKSIWDYCTTDWIVKVDLNYSRIERCSTSSTWLSIQKAFKGFSNASLITREKQLESDATALIPGTIGNITSFAARLGEIDIDEVLVKLKYGGLKYLKNKSTNYAKVIGEKYSLLMPIESEV